MAKVVLTRDEARGAVQAEALRNRGHEVAFVPLTMIVGGRPFPDPAPFDGVLFTSVNSVERAPFNAAWPRVGAVGSVTAAALAARKIRVDVLGDGGGAELASSWGPARGQSLLLPQATDAHPALEQALRAAGAEVVCVPVYTSVARPEVDRRFFEQADVICFFAPSQVAAFRKLGVSTHARFAALGSTTRAAMRDLGPLVEVGNI